MVELNKDSQLTPREKSSLERRNLIVDMDKVAEPVSGLKKFADVFLDYSSEPVNAVLSLEFAAEAARNSEIGDVFLSTRAMLVQSMKKLMKRGIECGQFRTDLNLDEAPKMVLDLIEALALRSAPSDGKIPNKARAELHLLLEKYLYSQGPDPRF